MKTEDTARFISHFSSILADEADRNNLSNLARLLRDVEAEANEHLAPAPLIPEAMAEFAIRRRH
jgi:hypothetical protein